MVKAKKASRKGQNSSAQPPIGAIVYRGPSRLPPAQRDDDLVTTQVNFYGSVTSTAGGILNTVWDSWSQLSNTSDWTSFQALFQECRILSMRVTLVPWNKFNQPTTSALAPVISVLDRDSAAALTSLNGSISYASAQVHEPSMQFSRVIKMGDTAEATFTATNSSPGSTDRLYIKVYSAGNVVSTTLYDYYTELVVQFRGRN